MGDKFCSDKKKCRCSDKKCDRGKQLRCMLDYSKSRNIDLNVRDKDGQTPLHYACEWMRSVQLKLFFRRAKTLDLDVNVRDNNGRTPFHLACLCSHFYLYRSEPDKYYDNWNNNQALKTLFKYASSVGIDIEATDNYGRTPLHYLCLTKCEQEVNIYKKMAVNYNVKMNENAVDNNGKTPKDLAKISKQVQLKVKGIANWYKYGDEQKVRIIESMLSRF